MLTDLKKPVVVIGAAARMGLDGMGGAGKCVLAHDRQVRQSPKPKTILGAVY